MQSDFISFGIQEGEDLSIPIVSKGEKILMVDKVESKESKDSKKPMVEVTFTCPDEPQALPVKHNFMKPDPTVSDAGNKLRKADWAGFCNAFALPLQFNVVEVNASKPRGFVVIRHETYNGRLSAKIEKFITPVKA